MIKQETTMRLKASLLKQQYDNKQLTKQEFLAQWRDLLRQESHFMRRPHENKTRST